MFICGHVLLFIGLSIASGALANQTTSYWESSKKHIINVEPCGAMLFTSGQESVGESHRHQEVRRDAVCMG
jgi:hypothetical protein